jgi:hypothetical protein
VGERQFIGSLTGLRFIAAATVAVGHGALSLRQDWLSQLVAQISSVGMTLFFVLSGFVLWLNYAASFQTKPLSGALREFAVARFARLYPMYAVVVLGIVGYLMVSRGVDLRSLGFILTMTQAWFPALGGTMMVAVVASLQHLWSISVELFFYLLFPLACFGLRRADRPPMIALLALLNLLLFAVAIWASFGHGTALLRAIAPGLRDGGMQWLTYYSPYLHVSQFLAGCLAAMAYIQLETRKIGEREQAVVAVLFWLSVAGLLAVPVALFLQPGWGDFAVWIEISVRLVEVICFSVILVAASRYGHARWLSSRPMIVGGECSYSIYLLHPFLIRLAMIGKSDAPGAVELVLRLGLFVMIATAIAWITYMLIEAPARTWLRKAFGTSAPRDVIRAKPV